MCAPVLRRVECLCVAGDVVVQLLRRSFRKTPQLRGLAGVFRPILARQDQQGWQVREAGQGDNQDIKVC